MSANKIPLALQLYSVRDDCARDLPGTLAEVAKIGYAGVEFAGYYGYTAKELRKMLDDLGLKCAGTHTQLPTVLGDELNRTVEFNQILGNPYLIVPWLDEKYRPDANGWLLLAEAFNSIAKTLAGQKMHAGYHNHDFEFRALPGGTHLPWDLFFGHTSPEVIMQFDTGNAKHAGADAAEFLQRYPGRAVTVHLKEHSSKNKNALIGEGEVRWPEIFSLCESSGNTAWYIVEQETYAYPPLECVRLCLEKLRALGK